MSPAAKKKWGQHFLSDAAVLAQLATAIKSALAPSYNILEIGPGQGALTKVLLTLLESAQTLQVIEIDNDCIRYLQQHFSNECATQRIQITQGDVLAATTLTSVIVPDSNPYLVVGNLPYNISSPLLFSLLRYRSQIATQLFMLQKEVVDRINAAPNSRLYGRLSVMLQSYYRTAALFDVAKEAFTPPPKVLSAVIKMVPLPIQHAFSFASLEKVVALAFSQRRKKISNTLGKHFSTAQLESLDISLDWRAENISVHQYQALAQLAESLGTI